MAHGQSDFGAYAAKTTVGSLSDMADLAVRLGSIVEYDRRGDIIALDDFEAPVLKWGKTTPGASAVVLSSESVKANAQAVKLSSDALPGLRPAIFKYFYGSGAKQLGIEISFSKLAETSNLRMRFEHSAAGGSLRGMVILDASARTCFIEDETLGDVVIASDLRFPIYEHCFIPFKIVCDFDTGKYMRVLLGNTQYDVSAYSLKVLAYLPPEQEFVELRLGNDATATASDIYLDAFIITQNEP